MELHPKIVELKKRAAPINYSNLSVGEAGALTESESLLDQRIVEGYAVIWGKRNHHGEKFLKGAFAKSIRERGPGSGATYEVKFLYNHNTDEPLSLFAELMEDEIGLYFRTKPLDAVPMAERTLTQIKSGTLNNFSQGFDYVWDKIEWDESDDSLVIKEASLFEISVATIPSGMDTYVIRSAEELESEQISLHDETENFIKSIPRKQQLELRQLIARHISLKNVEPLEVRQKALDVAEPVEAGIDYSYLQNNLKLF